jgi:hypothetical protein
MVMISAQAMLMECGLDAFLKKQRAQETKNKMRNADAKNMEFTPTQIYYMASFELAIRDFDIQIG